MSSSSTTDADVEYLTADGSLTKTIVLEGQGEPAGRDAKVSLRYSLRLSEDLGTSPFDSSAKRRDGLLRFTLGKKKVIPALELVAQSMKVGERCLARSASAYAFGAKGLKKKGVPGGAAIYLEVEMVDIQGGEKVKVMGEMTARERFSYAKECKEVGNDLFKEQKFDKALLQYSKSIQYLANVFYRPSPRPVRREVSEVPDKVGSDPNEKEEEGFEAATIVEEDAAEKVGIDKENDQPADGKVNVNGTSEATPGDSSGKGDDAEEVIDVTGSAVSASEAPARANGEVDAERGDVADNKAEHQEGDVAVQTGKEGDVAGEGAADVKEENDDPDEKEVRALHVTTLNNLSLCCVRLEQYRKAVETASLAIKLDPRSSKALYYRGRAKICLGEWESARADLVAALELWDNPGIKNEILRLDRKRKQFAEREKKQAAAMFA